MFESILVPLDGSAFAEAALPPATTIASRENGSLDLVMVQDPVPAYGYGALEEQPQAWRAEYLAAVEEELASRLQDRVQYSLLVGSVTAELERHAEETDPDLLVMATHGRGPFSRFWLGSVADHIVRHSTYPVLLIRPEESQEVDVSAPTEFDHVLVPLDGSEEGETILDVAGPFGEIFDARYTLTRVVHYPAEVVSSYMPDTVHISEEIVESGKAEAEKYLEGVAGKLRDAGYTVDVDVRVDVHPASGIQRAAEEVGADVVALATHGRGGVERTLVGSVADKLIRSTHLPTLVIRPQ
ncbi:MAG: universal stress protein [Longimicrobiales bacterium]|nr:universal stress protein [Longimicrobiales bacterium]